MNTYKVDRLCSGLGGCLRPERPSSNPGKSKFQFPSFLLFQHSQFHKIPITYSGRTVAMGKSLSEEPIISLLIFALICESPCTVDGLREIPDEYLLDHRTLTAFLGAPWPRPRFASPTAWPCCEKSEQLQARNGFLPQVESSGRSFPPRRSSVWPIPQAALYCQCHWKKYYTFTLKCVKYSRKSLILPWTIRKTQRWDSTWIQSLWWVFGSL